MESGECIGILFLLAIMASIGYYGYRSHRCPICGSYRTMTREVSEWVPLDDTVDFKDVFFLIITYGDHRSKRSCRSWVDRCRVCGFEIKGEETIDHY